MMNANRIADIYKNYLFYLYIPISLIMWIFLVTGKPFFIGAGSLSTFFLITYVVLFPKKVHLDLNYLYVFLFLAYCLILTSLHYSKYDMIDSEGRSLAMYHYGLYVYYLVSYLYGRISKFNNNSLTHLIFGLTLILISTISDLKHLSMNFDSMNEDMIGIYLLLSDVFTIFLIFIISNIKKNYIKNLIFIIGCLALLILNSRSSLYAFIIVFLVYQTFFLSVKSRLIAAVLFISIISVLISTQYLDYILDSNPRMLAIITGLDQDASKVSRDELLSIGFNRILDSPIKGDYGGVIEEFGNLGSYIHNILSYWQSYGIIPFLFAIFLLIFQPLSTAYKAYFSRKTYHTDLYFNLSIYLVLLVVVSKSYSWHYAWFIVGVLHNYKHCQLKTLQIKNNG